MFRSWSRPEYRTNSELLKNLEFVFPVYNNSIIRKSTLFRRICYQISFFVRQQKQRSQFSGAINQGNRLVAKIANFSAKFSWKSAKFVAECFRRKIRRRTFKFCKNKIFVIFYYNVVRSLSPNIYLCMFPRTL